LVTANRVPKVFPLIGWDYPRAEGVGSLCPRVLWCTLGGRRGLRSSARLAGGRYLACNRYLVNADIGSSNLWQPQMRPAPASPAIRLGLT